VRKWASSSDEVDFSHVASPPLSSPHASFVDVLLCGYVCEEVLIVLLLKFDIISCYTSVR